jgi:hypothetical protein
MVMRRVPSVDPEELRKLCKYRVVHRARRLNAEALGFSIDACVRELEFYRYKIHWCVFLPRFIQRIIFKKAATVPLERDLPEMIEAARKN